MYAEKLTWEKEDSSCVIVERSVNLIYTDCVIVERSVNLRNVWIGWHELCSYHCVS